jgi:hypothetical protein
MFFKSKKQKAAEELQKQEKERLDDEEYNRWKAEDEAEKNIRAKADKDAFVSQALESAGADPEGRGMTNRQMAEVLYCFAKDNAKRATEEIRAADDRSVDRIVKMWDFVSEKFKNVNITLIIMIFLFLFFFCQK